LKAKSHKSLFEIAAVDIDGKRIEKLGNILSGKKAILVANVAQYCSLTEMGYTQMVKLHKEYRDRGFEILAFPCNQFGK
jgi:glutathione peroxidase